jgi:hypothetical protein
MSLHELEFWVEHGDRNAKVFETFTPDDAPLDDIAILWDILAENLDVEASFCPWGKKDLGSLPRKHLVTKLTSNDGMEIHELLFGDSILITEYFQVDRYEPGLQGRNFNVRTDAFFAAVDFHLMAGNETRSCIPVGEVDGLKVAVFTAEGVESYGLSIH